ncbi:hypothetical protein BS78_10G127300 [Paspalum vaginatum]|nr:hypothetical protein BS78_10G127300 [Paspalum vaginatum]
MAWSSASLLVFLVLLASPYLGCSYHTSYTHGGKHYTVRSNRDPRQPQQSCSLQHSEPSSSADGVPVVHRLSPCSPLGNGARKQEEHPSVADVLRRDALRLRSLFGADNHGSPAPSPLPGGGGSDDGVSIPNRGAPIEELPGAFDYHVVAGFGTPAQPFIMGFDTHTTGATLLQCQPCAANQPCGHAFDPSASSSIAQVPCGSPDCPFHGCSGRSCSLNNTFIGNVSFVTDTLTLTPSTTIGSFRFACLEVTPSDNSSGVLDLSRNSHSLASRAPSPPGTVAFSYCLPSSPGSVGFLSFGAAMPMPHKAIYTPLRKNPDNGNLYVVDLVGLRLGGPDLPLPPTAIARDTIVDLRTTFTYLKPGMYAALRDGFHRWMSRYPVAPPLGGLDTCYNFTGLDIFTVPTVTLKFAGGADVDLSMDEMMYFSDPKDHFSIGCLAFGARDDTAVIGSRVQMSTEVLYDLRGEKIGFVPYRC